MRVALEKSWAELADQRKISEGSDSKADIRVMELRESLSREHEAELKYDLVFRLHLLSLTWQ